MATKLFVVITLIALMGVLIRLFLNHWIYIPAIIDSFKYNNVEDNRPITWTTVSAAPSKTPNIIFILADDLGFNDISTYGGGFLNGTVQTPSIDSIGKSGAIFLQAYAGHATCAPSRASLLTGRFATKIGFEFTPITGAGSYILGHFLGSNELPAVYHSHLANEGLNDDSISVQSSQRTIADVLSQDSKSDYRKLYLGKWHNGHNSLDFTPVLKGFDEYLAFNIISSYLPVGHPDAVECPLTDVLDRFIRATVRYQIVKDDSNYFAPKGYLTDYLADEAVAAIHANKNNPFFLFLSFTAVHTPLQALKSDYDALSHIEDHCARVYASMLVALDRGVGKVLQALVDNGIDSNTMVIFTSDNGSPSYINQDKTNYPFRGWKATLFEGGLRVPLLVKWPGGIKPGQVIEDVVSHVDIFPTVASAADVDIAHEIDGLDLFTLMQPKASDSVETPPAHAQGRGETCNGSAPLDNISKKHTTLFWRTGHYMAMRYNYWKIQKSSLPDKLWLYDLRSDVGERVNLANSEYHKVVLAELLSLLLAVNATQEPPLWPALAEMPVLIDKYLMDQFQEGDEYIYWPN